ncbi:MAG: hypothetical protein K9L80_01550 [Candidatus Omnitrophica bacterium]|nr:hypothetical protein [Candidatus Omnitrophota bacterium]MCF7887494.1 hypothetical protein [Candidatus Omnitrophota bacterium]MCF7888043.1 hypothetical protein [Candidatus Omnitrophota bacterium]
MRKSQSLLNYALLMVVIGLAFFGMQKYFKRGIQGKVASFSDAMIAPRADHLAYTDEDMSYSATSSQQMSSQTTLYGAGAQTTTSRMEATSSSYTETTDEDYIPGGSSGLGSSGGGLDKPDPIDAN